MSYPPQSNPPQPYPPQGQVPAPMQQAPAPLKKGRNTVGIVALVMAVIGFIFACVPGALILAWSASSGRGRRCGRQSPQ